MTELLEKRIKEVAEAVENGVVVQADAQFLLQMLIAQGDNVAYLNEEIEKLKLERDAAVESLDKIANPGEQSLFACREAARAVLAMIDL